MTTIDRVARQTRLLTKGLQATHADEPMQGGGSIMDRVHRGIK